MQVKKYPSNKKYCIYFKELFLRMGIMGTSYFEKLNELIES